MPQAAEPRYASGDGRQYVSWIHDRNFIRAVNWLIDHDLAGPVNLASPHPRSERRVHADASDRFGTGFGLPATRWMLEVEAFSQRTETELVLKSRRVIPGRLVERDSGLNFRIGRKRRWTCAAGGESSAMGRSTPPSHVLLCPAESRCRPTHQRQSNPERDTVPLAAFRIRNRPSAKRPGSCAGSANGGT